MQRFLWKKLPIGGRMGHRVGGKLCPMCQRLEDHKHVLRHCRFSPFIFDMVRKAFGLVRQEGGGGVGTQPITVGSASPVPAKHVGPCAMGGFEGPVGFALS